MYFNQDVKSKSYSISFDKKQEVTLCIWWKEVEWVSYMVGRRKHSMLLTRLTDEWMNMGHTNHHNNEVFHSILGSLTQFMQGTDNWVTSLPLKYWQAFWRAKLTSQNWTAQYSNLVYLLSTRWSANKVNSLKRYWLLSWSFPFLFFFLCVCDFTFSCLISYISVKKYVLYIMQSKTLAWLVSYRGF